MSWWDTSGFSNLASQALKNAQKKIDKVLDIEEDATKKKGGSPQNPKAVQKEEEKSQKGAGEGDFWSGWLGTGGSKSNEEKESTSPSHSSWNLPWTLTSGTPEADENQASQASKAVSGTSSSESGTSRSSRESKHAASRKPPTVSAETSVSKPLLDVDTKPRQAHHATAGQSQETHETEQPTTSNSDSFQSEWKDFAMEDNVAENKGPDITVKHEQSSEEMQSSGWSVDDMDITESVSDINTAINKDGDETNTMTGGDDVTSQRPIQSIDNFQKDSKTAVGECLVAPITEETNCLNESAILEVQLEENSLKNSSSSVFTALSDEHLPEPMSSSSPTFIQNKDIPVAKPTISQQETGSKAEESKALTTSILKSDISEISVSVSSDVSLLDISKSSDEENISAVDSENKQRQNKSDKEIVEVEKLWEKQGTDLSQGFVSVSASGQSVLDVPTDTSTISSDELLHSSSEMDTGYSRTSSDLDLLGGHASSTGSSDTSKFDSSLDTVVDRSLLDPQSNVEVAIEREAPYSLFGRSQHEDSGPGSEEAKGENVQSENSHSMSSSYVTCMLEEAMEDLNKTEDSGSDNHSNGEKSESSKVDSELEKSVYSGHESSDEIETTTSSDIEIISAPTPNGDNKYSSAPYDLSPLKIALQRASRDQGHNRSDSQSSSSAHSKAGEGERLSPERGEGAAWREDSDFPHHDLQAVREEDTNNPYHPERLLKLSHAVVVQQLQGGQKLAEMAEVLQARENKLIQLSKENHQLMEDNTILRNQLKQAEEAREAETADLTAMSEEFSARIGEGEKKLQAVLKEKESLKQKLALAEAELEKRSANSNLEALLEEKREQVEELLQEGEKLSKQQLQSSNIIKKLRVKEKENDATITSQKKKLDEVTKEMERLTTILDSKEEMEKKQAEAINQLNSAVQRQEKELTKLRSDLEDAQEKSRGLQAALDNSYKEIAELHRSNATQDSKAQEAALSAETLVREELKAAMEREQQKFKQEREAFIMQADDLRLDMTRLEKEHSRREDLLRQEISHLQERLQQDEARSQDLSQSVTSATRPLLRQIENLQTTYAAQSAAWERVEKNLTDRLAEAQTALAMAQEKERTANERHMELSAKVATLEASNARLKQEKAELSVQLENDKAQLEELQDARNSIVAQLETSKQKLSQELTQLKIDQVNLESQLTVERTRLENEKKKTLALEEQLRIAERPRSRGTPSPSPSMSISRQESLAGSVHEWTAPGGMGWSYHEDTDSGSTAGGSKSNMYDSLRHSGAAIVVENLSAQLKSREGEITQLHSEIGQLERTRESMARELVNLTNQNEELLEIKKSHEELQEQFNDLNSRYSAILQMYGEKEEQVQELRLDLQDVKEMYKTQIDALLAK